MTARERRTLLLGAALIVAAVLGTRVLPAMVRAHAGLRVRASERTELLARAQDAIAAENAHRDSLARLADRVLALGPRLVAVGTAVEAGAELAALVAALVRQHRLRLLRLDPRPTTLAPPVGPVAVRVELEGDIAGLAGWLAAVESGHPLLAVGALSVVVLDPQASERAPEVLRVEADLTGWFLLRERAP
jgi:hypothetical protein